MKKTALFFLLLAFGCASKPKTPAVHVSLVNNNRSVKCTGLDYAIMSEINRDTLPGIWENLIPVYRMPADTDMKDYQPIQHGKYQLSGSVTVFTPDTPFAKGQVYFMRYYRFEGATNAWDFIKGKKKLRDTKYIDLIFTN